MKSTLFTLLNFIIILPLLMPVGKLTPSPSLKEIQPVFVQSEIGEDKDDHLSRLTTDTTQQNLEFINQQQSSLPIYGPAVVLQEDLDSSTIDLLPAYTHLSGKLEDGFGSFDILKEGNTYYMWIGSRVRTGAVSNVTSIEQRFESQDGITWHNRTNTNLTRTNMPYKLVWGLREVIKTANGYEGWEEYYYEWTVGWGGAIRYITSTNGITWTVVNEPALIGARYQSVVKDGNNYYMWEQPDADSNLYDGSRSLRYRVNSNGGSGWGNWQTGGTLVTLDGNGEVTDRNRIRRLPDGTYQLFYLNGSHINIATSPDGLNFITQVTDLLDIVEVLPVDNINLVVDFAVAEIEGEDWFYFTYCESYSNLGLCQNGHIAVSRPIHYANLEISKTASPAAVSTGELLTYTLTFSHSGQNSATGIIITDIVPISLTDVSIASSGVIITDTGYSPGYVWQVQDLPPNVKGIITITGRVSSSLSSGTNLINTATITSTTVDTDTLNNTAFVTTPIQPTANLALSKVATPSVVLLGQPLTYTLTFSNTGSDTATGVVITDFIPISLTNVTVTSSGVAITDTGSNPGYVWNVQDLAPGAKGVITIMGQLNSSLSYGTSLTNTATITTTTVETNTLNNTASVTTSVRPTADLVLSKHVTSSPSLVGMPLTYTLLITNLGPSDATNLTIFDPLPAGLNFISASSPCQSVNQEVTCTLPGLPTGVTTTLTLVVTPTVAGLITNTASFTATQFDPDLSNNTATAHILVSESTITLPSYIYLAMILRDLDQPPATFPLHIGDAIPIRPPNSTGEIFYTKQVQIPTVLPTGGHFYFSSRPDIAAKALVDDELAVLLADGTQVFVHRVGPVPNFMEVPRPTMEQIAGQTVTIEYRDVFGSVVWATDMWLIWVP